MKLARTSALIGATLALLAMGSSALAADGRPSSADRAFVAAASESNATEIAFGKEAIENGDAATRTFARRMVQSHTTLGQSLARAARPLNLKIYETPSVKQARVIAKTVKLDGTAFDRAYRSGQVAAHRATLLIFEKEVAHGSDPGLKKVARSAIPTIRMHLAMATKLAASPMP